MSTNWTTARWRKSVLSDSGGCVEVAYSDGQIGVRDTKAQDRGPILEFNETEWRAFIGGVRNGQFDYDHLVVTR